MTAVVFIKLARLTITTSYDFTFDPDNEEVFFSMGRMEKYERVDIVRNKLLVVIKGLFNKMPTDACSINNIYFFAIRLLYWPGNTDPKFFR